MKSVRIAELEDRPSEHLRAVERGAEVEVRDRDRPIARLVPVDGSEARPRIVPAKRPFPGLRDRRARPARGKTPSLDPLLEERGRR